MKTNKTELVFILDRSGSMAGLESDTIGGFNAMLAKQKQEEGEANVTTVLFDDRYELLHDRISIGGVSPMTDRDYTVRGSTALLDAIGNTINKLGSVQKSTSDDHRAEKVLFVITTDGLENASREFSYDKIKEMISRQKEKYGWEFVFLGANIDAISTAERFGISEDRAVNFVSDSIGTTMNYSVMSSFVSDFRGDKTINRNWKSEIEKDHKKRGKK
jgi:uncharacterized protein YegL